MTVNRNAAVRAVPAVFLAVSSITVLLRCYVRLRLVKAFGWDDGLMVLAMAVYAMFCGVMIGGSLYGTGKHFADLTPSHRVTAMEYWWLCEIGYCFSSIFCKCSICIFLTRITIKRPHLAFLYIIMTCTVLMGLVLMFSLLLQCRPVSYFWTRVASDPTVEGTCVKTELVIALTWAYSAVAACCDLAVGIVPYFIVRKLNMPWRRKVAAIGICSIGCIACCAVIVRIPYVPTFADPDFLYATYEVAVWSNVEVGLGIFAGSLATLHPLLKYLRTFFTKPRMMRLSSRSSSGPGHTAPKADFVSVSSYPSAPVTLFRPGNVVNTTTTIQGDGAGVAHPDSYSPRASRDTVMRTNDILIQQTFNLDAGWESRNSSVV
ncbi:integral membrane protein [Aspergillus eucalypticola CBS 122712]|uniref:Integral membrane protein n=1 Tax=Aspergillus eucalypticola (strain CBS 122712 / IBT 29274) TaxID=1448314 RepID=A0A317VAN2_ASPEC|nr:uncharacterized protein BO83DRAFT_314777 [Aspergillus eucalypticola CBS 122712]PWY71155.1 integral membrane protein [Aspergillus eucalypticola CBS 122712]